MNDYQNMRYCMFWVVLFVIVAECRNIKPKQNQIENFKVDGYGTIDINFTPCTNKECSKENRHRISTKHHHSKHSRHKHRRGRKHERQLPTPKGQTIQLEDGNTASQNYGWYMDSNVPSGVARLESRLHPNIRHAAKQFMDNLQSILLKIQHKIRIVDSEYVSIGTTSRKSMIEVREELALITDENNKAYDALLDVSQLVRYVYRRAHENGRGDPSSSMALRSYPQLHIVNLKKDFRKTQLAYQNASLTYSHVMNMKRRGVQQDAAKSGVMTKVKDKTLSEKFRLFEMYDIQQKVRQILQKVDTLSGNIFIPLQRRIMKYKTWQNIITKRMKHALYLTDLAYESTKMAENTFQMNKKYHDRIKLERRHRSSRHKRSTEYGQLEILVQRAVRKSKQLDEISSMTYRKLLPLLTMSEKAIKDQESAGGNILFQIRNILTKLTATMLKFEDKMDEVRIFINESKILEARCVELDGKESIIDCDIYGMYEGSGSKEDITDDEDDLFTIRSTTIQPQPRTPKSSKTTHIATTSSSQPSSMPKSTTTGYIHKKPTRQKELASTVKPTKVQTSTALPRKSTLLNLQIYSTSTAKPTSIKTSSSLTTKSTTTTKTSTSSTAKTTTTTTTTTSTTSTAKPTTTTKTPTTSTVTTTTTMKSKSPVFENTTLRTITTTIDDVFEGSGITNEPDEKDGDFVFDTKTPMTTDSTTVAEEGSGEKDNEFTFEEDKKEESEENGGWWPFGDDPNVLYDPLLDFKEKLSNLAFKKRVKSEDILGHWSDISHSYKDMSHRWMSITSHLMHLGTFVNAASGLKMSWNTIEPVVDRIMKDLPMKTKDIIGVAQLADNSSERALSVINEKLTKMLQIKQKQLSKAGDNDQGPAFIAELISTVEMVKQNTKAIKDLQQINPSPCKDVQNTATRLRNNIAQLRSKIDKAKTITSSIPITVALNGEDFVKATSPQQDVSVSPSSLIEMCIKPNKENMQLATFYGNSSQSYSFLLNDLKPVLTVSEGDGTSLGTVSFESALQKDEWTSVSFRRNGHTVQMKLNDINGTSEVVEKSYLSDITTMHSPITSAIIGSTKASSDLSYFSGCIADLMVNGKYLAYSKHQTPLRPCNSDCNLKRRNSIIFEGDGFAKFSLYLIDASYIDNIDLEFQTMQKEGVLLFINDKLKSLQVVISLSEGALHTEVRTRRGTTVLTSSKDTYSDGQHHKLKMVFGNDVVNVTTDDTDDKFKQELARQEIASIDNGIYLGGLDVQSHSLSGKTKLRSFSGCISLFSISNKEIPLYMIEDSKNVYYGKCNENIWQKCVKFYEQSKPLKYLGMDAGGRIYIILRTNSIGTLFDYKRLNGEDFDVTFFIDNTGVEISDNKEKTEYKLASEKSNKDWLVLSVEDKDKERLIVRLGTSLFEVPYSIPFRWFSKKTVYDFAFGGLIDSEESTLLGGIASLIIDDKAIDLQSITRSNNLQICERSTMDFHESIKEEKPVC